MRFPQLRAGRTNKSPPSIQETAQAIALNSKFVFDNQ
jgi:hypothetical protein